MNTVDRVKSICKERKIPIYKLEKDLGFSNAYISQLKKGSIPNDRLIKIAEYLNLSVEFLTTGKEEITPLFSKSDYEILTLFNQLTDKQKELVITTCKALIESNN